MYDEPHVGIDVERAQYAHDQFVARMRERGVEVFLLSELLAEALAASDDGRHRLIELVASEYTVSLSLVDEVRRLLADLKPDQRVKVTPLRVEALDKNKDFKK